MLQLYDRSKNKIGLIKDATEITVVSTLATGDKTLQFKYSKEGEKVEDIVCEGYVRTKTDEYVIKAIEPLTKEKKITATLNLEELEGKTFEGGFRMILSTFEDIMDVALEGTGWSVALCEVIKKRTIAKDAGSSALDIIGQCIKTYKIEIRYDTIEKKIYAYEHIGEDRGAYFMEDLNLKSMAVSENTYTYYTRILPIGKDGMRIGSVNNGCDYLEDYTYSDKKKTYVWIDERYSVPESMKEDAGYKLHEMATPYITYEAEVKNLAANSEEYKEILMFALGDTVTLVSKSEKTRTKERIAKLTEYLLDEEQNTCELSSTKQTFVELQQDETEATADSVSAGIASGTQEANAYSDTLFEMLSDEIDEIAIQSEESVRTVNLMAEKMNALSLKVDELTEQAAGSGVASDAIVQKIEAVQNSVNEIKTAVDGLKTSQEQMQEKLGDLASDHTAISEQIAGFQQANEAQHNQQQADITEIKTQQESTAEAVAEIKTQQAEDTQTIQSNSTGINILKERARAIQEDVVAHTGTISEMNEKLNQIILLLTPQEPDPDGGGTGSEGERTGSEGEGTGSEGEGTGSEGEGTGSEGEGTGSEGEGTGSEDEGTGSTTEE